MPVSKRMELPNWTAISLIALALHLLACGSMPRLTSSSELPGNGEPCVLQTGCSPGHKCAWHPPPGAQTEATGERERRCRPVEEIKACEAPCREMYTDCDVSDDRDCREGLYACLRHYCN